MKFRVLSAVLCRQSIAISSTGFFQQPKRVGTKINRIRVFMSILHTVYIVQVRRKGSFPHSNDYDYSLC